MEILGTTLADLRKQKDKLFDVTLNPQIRDKNSDCPAKHSNHRRYLEKEEEKLALIE